MVKFLHLDFHCCPISNPNWPQTKAIPPQYQVLMHMPFFFAFFCITITWSCLCWCLAHTFLLFGQFIVWCLDLGRVINDFLFFIKSTFRYRHQDDMDLRSRCLGFCWRLLKLGKFIKVVVGIVGMVLVWLIFVCSCFGCFFVYFSIYNLIFSNFLYL